MTRHATPQYLLELNSKQNGECLEYIGHTDPHGYGRVMIAGKLWLTHRLAWSLANGPIPEGLLVRHKCDNPPCIRADHLELGTHADNMRDRKERGRYPIGAAVNTSRLTETQAREILAGIANGAGIRETARAYGVSHTAIRHIACGKNWAHLAGGQK